LLLIRIKVEVNEHHEDKLGVDDINPVPRIVEVIFAISLDQLRLIL
jgi:hypothetical protein